ncbi:MAG: aminoacetone oxidase family FAD-binding enzyme [Candidatus Daviesbacteria bacterium]|nr:aminoacetone oxidase family FAD-binding enzyme [Candidatus Daviesbacteria bacterium]
MKDDHNFFDVIVIGGGAAGMMAAGQAGNLKKKVLLIEKNRNLGEKLRITGGLRCNITNAEFDTRAFLDNYGSSKDFLFSPFSKFGAKETFSFFESLGLPLVIQARNRAFPYSEKASDVCEALKENLRKTGVHIKTGCIVKEIIHREGIITGIETNQGIFRAKSFILATGGVSHPETGSTGDGFKWLKELGHTVKTPTPSIVPLEVKEEWVKMLSGVSLSFMKITFFLDGKKQFSKVGKVLFTHFGLSGPLILNSASKIGDLLQNGKVTALIDAYPDTDLGALDRSIINILNNNKNKALRTIFKDLVPAGTAPGIQALLTDIDFDTKVHSISKENRKKIVNLLKALPVTITNLMGYERAVIADGGVYLSEIDTKTMGSKIIKNLYIVGDLLNINRPSGGFSLQLCWTTGFVAGSSA